MKISDGKRCLEAWRLAAEALDADRLVHSRTADVGNFIRECAGLEQLSLRICPAPPWSGLIEQQAAFHGRSL